jgi:hypothetical protein
LSSQERDSHMNVRKELTDLARQAVSLSSDVQTELASFPSNAVMLDVRFRGRLFVLAYSPQDGFGVDEVEEDVVGLGTWFRHNYDDFISAKEKLLALLTTALHDPEGNVGVKQEKRRRSALSPDEELPLKK